MTKTPVKFPKNQYKTVGGVAPTRYPLSIHIVIMSEKWLRSTCKKVTKKFDDYIQTTCISSDHDQKPVKFGKNQYKTDGRTDGRKDGEAKTKSLCWQGTIKVMEK